MNLKMKGLLVAILVCALSALIFANNIAYSAPRTTTGGPLATSKGGFDLTLLPGYTNTTVIPTEGYRQVTIYLKGEQSINLPTNIRVEIANQITIGTSQWTSSQIVWSEIDDFIWAPFGGSADQVTINRTFAVQGDSIRILLRNLDGVGTWNLRLGWYLTE